MKKYLFLFGLLLSNLSIGANTFGKVRGNGNVTVKEHHFNSNFHSIEVGSGIEVYLIHGTKEEIKVETDENLQEVITLELTKGSLKISTNKNITKSTKRNVYVTYVNLKSLTAKSGADIKNKEALKAQKLNLYASSGGDIEIILLSEEVTANASSGGEIDLQGKTLKLNAGASSGGEIDAEHLEAIDVIAKASSGGSVKVNVKNSFNATASTGGEIQYYGNPVDSKIMTKISGRIKKKIKH